MLQGNQQLNGLKLQLCLSLLSFGGAFLLFEVEPLAGKIITPLLGGTSEVWVVCLLFFQLAVLAGYLLTYLLNRFSRKIQLVAYVSIFFISLFWADVPTAQGWSVNSQGQPVFELLKELTYHLGIPCMLLSSISGTTQVWYALSGASNPYRLYSLSNLGSFASLFAYPVLLEPFFSVAPTLRIWRYMYYFLFVLIAVSSKLLWPIVSSIKRQEVESASSDADIAPITSKQITAWLLLSALGSAALLAFSSYITTDVSPVPLLWILPLAIYLLTFVIAFGTSKVNTDKFVSAWIPLVIIELLCTYTAPVIGLVVNLMLLFILCLVANSRLVACKPQAKHLPTFYLAIAFGSTVGSILLALIAPLCFNFSADRSIIILIFTVYMLLDQPGLTKKRMMLRVGISAMLILALSAYLIFPTPDTVHRERNFFGSVSLKHEEDMLTLYHGRVKHGQQYIDPSKGAIDVYPYGKPAALVFSFMHQIHEPLNVCVIGLGAGSMAVEGEKGDRILFYEIDPKIDRIAKQWFTYIAHSKANTTVEVGDGRLLLKNNNEMFDGICIDAFRGDAVPVHLLTTEAMKIYLQHLKPHGLIFMHITNNYLNLPPIVGNAAKKLNLSGCYLVNDKTVKYMVLSPDKGTMAAFTEFAKANGAKFDNTAVYPMPSIPGLGVWTDDFSNVLTILRWRTDQQ